jgi:hypothetical protein
VNVGVFHAWGDGTALATQGHASGISAGYTADQWRVQYAYTSQTDAIKESVATTASGDLAATAYNSKGWLLGASYVASDRLTLKAGASHYDLSAPSDNLSSLTSLNGFALASSITQYKGSDITAQLNWVGVNYKASDKVTVYSGLYRANYNGYASTPVSSGTYTATPAHINWGSLLVDYQLDESKDTYIALADIGLVNNSTSSAITGSTKSSSSYATIGNNSLLSVGFRYKF